MKKILFMTLLLASSLSGYTQVRKDSDGGVHFEQGLTWQQVLTKAKAEHKFIFVDCYATWCGPCKEMEKSVYPVDSVGRFFNDHFLCVKVQMDRTAKDNDTVKGWYDDAKMLETDYQVRAYPTFLFFDENGKAVHRAEGYQDAGGFIQTARNAIDPLQQYYTLFNAYNAHQLKYSLMPVLAIEASRLGEKNLALKVAADYMHNYLDKLRDKEFLAPNNINFIDNYKAMVTPNDRSFKLCYNEPVKVDNAMQDKDFANRFVIAVITNTDVTPLFDKSKTTGIIPDFKTIGQTVAKKYNASYANIVVTNGRVSWYAYLIRDKKQEQYWPDYTEALISQIQKFRYDTVAGMQAMGINNISWQIFVHNSNKRQLLSVAEFMKHISDRNPRTDYLDTYACLLYKAGQTNEAIAIEEGVLETATKNNNQRTITYTQTTVDKMKNGEPIWTEKGYMN